jgi:predicted pyridoxine 5'-phosphate oxidase superfamily flavin-nucleotide-binding protein
MSPRYVSLLEPSTGQRGVIVEQPAGHQFSKIVFTPTVRALQKTDGSRASYAKNETGEPHHDRLGEREAAFIDMRDSFYMATVTETGWPYIQHRGGPPGFLRVLDEKTLAFADFRGNRQYVSVGNLANNDRVALFLMDYAHQARLKILGRARVADLKEDPALAAKLALPGYRAKPERAFIITVEGFDWNCSQHITQRFTIADVTPAVDALKARIAELESELQKLRASG